MSFFWLLHSLDDRPVDPEADGDREKSQDEVRNHTDDTESCQGKQHDQRGAEDKPSLLHISPEDQVVHCKRKGRKLHGHPEPLARTVLWCVLHAWEAGTSIQLQVPPPSETLIGENHICQGWWFTLQKVPLVSGQAYKNVGTYFLEVALEVQWGKVSFTSNVSAERMVEQVW